jgi:Phage portal protein
VRLLDRMLSRYGSTYWEGEASGAAVLTTTYGSGDREKIMPQMAAWAQNTYAGNSVVFSAILQRMLLFSEVTFQFQALDDKHLYGDTSLSILEEPFGPGSTTGELLCRLEQDVSLAGNAFLWKSAELGRLVRLRPDWVTIVSELTPVPGGGVYRKVIGYWVQPPKSAFGEGDGQSYPADEVMHWAPVPDPQADFRGMSWLTPVYRDVLGDDGLSSYKVRYLQNSASPNLLIKYAAKLQPATLDSIAERMRARHGGVDNAFKTLVLDQGADVTVIGNSLQQMDFTNVGSAGAERIFAAAGVPGVLAGIEPLKGAGKGYQESMRKFADNWARPQWRSACGSLAMLLPEYDPATNTGLTGGSRLWFDVADIAALQDGAMERGQTALVNAQAVLTYFQAGATLASAVAAVESGDLSQIKAAPVPPPPAPPVQNELGQPGQPGVVASPLPPAGGRLPVGPVSPAGGDKTRPAPQPAAGRRSVNGRVPV